MAAPSGRPGWAWPVTFPVALAGLGVSAYLTFIHYTEPASLSCPATGVINCTKVTTSAQSMLFGTIPVVIPGLVFFTAMALLTLPRAWARLEPALDWLRLTGAVAGVGMVVYLVYVEVVELDAICLWCTAVHVLTFALFVGVLAATLLRPVDDATG